MSIGAKVALITGAGQGIGRAMTRRLATDGYTVVAADINLTSAEAVAAEVESTGGAALAVEVDVASESSCSAMVAATISRYGRIDVLINNAAIFSTILPKPLWDLSIEEWQRTIAVNVTGTWLAIKAVSNAMRSARSGSIINISSATVLGGRPNYLHYVTSKAAVIGLTRSAARELGEFGIRVNCIMPGSIDTGIARDTVSPERLNSLIASQAIHRRGVPTDIAAVAAFLASEDAAFLTGQTLNVDGGNAFL